MCQLDLAEIAEWIWSLGDRIDLHDDCDFLFRESCRLDYTEVIEMLIRCNQDDPEIRYLQHRSNYFVVGSAVTDHVTEIGGVMVSALRPAAEDDARTACEMVLRKKSARSADE